MSRFPRAYRRQLEATDRRNVDRAVQDAGPIQHTPGATAPGDGRKLRGIPAIGRGVSGAIRDTRPGDGLR
jgi:hypothetical protein